jgi:penicillin-binding protein 1A
MAINPVQLSQNIRRFWKLFGGVVALFALYFILTSIGLLGEMPSFEELENPDSNLATEIYSSDDVLLGKFYRENRSPIQYQDLPQHLVDALIATEDERFREHSGIDARGTLRALKGMGKDGGASTITQQLAKLLFHGEGSRNIIVRIHQKVKEWIIAVRLERHYTKNEIIAMYLNRADFVNHAVGIRSAARVYFSKEPKDLAIEEAALLVGMLKNPSYFNPNRASRYELVFNRRNTVFQQMVRNKYLEKEAAEQLSKLPIKLNFKYEDHNEGTATYFREYLRDYMKKWAETHFKPNGEKYNIYGDGLKIYTTIDSRMQQYAEEAVEEHVKNLQKQFFASKKGQKNAPFVNITQGQIDAIMTRSMKNSVRWQQMISEGKSEEEVTKSFTIPTEMRIFTWKGERDTVMTPMDSIRYYKHFINAGLVSIEPQTGHVKAWVGGINFKHFKYDHAGKAKRQVGSSFKPFVYATAIEQLNMSPCDTIRDAPFTIPRGRHNVGSNWTPKNSDGKYRGLVTLKSALAASLNTVSARLIDKVGPKAVIDLTHRLGVTTNIPEQPAICLGAVEITVEEMVAAFSTFANQGIYTKPQFITRIEDKNGNIIYEAIPESQDVMSQDVAYATLKLMEGVTEDGTSKRLRWGGGGVANYPYKFTNAIAGKTGTTQNNSDGWFIGIVPNLATGVWAGCEDRSAHFRDTARGQGATMALPIWGLFMHKCYQNKELQISQEDFLKPKDIAIRVDCNVFQRDTTQFDQNFSEFNFY